MIWVPKTQILDDIHYEDIEVEIDFDKYSELDKRGWRAFKHQEDGIKFLYNQKNVLLADEMGLGKTIQTLAVIQHYANEFNELRKAGMQVPDEASIQTWIDTLDFDDTYWNGPSLVVCPKSLLYNWKSEAAKFAPNLRTVIYNGIQRQKKLLEFPEVDLVIMSYGTLRNDIELLKKFEYRCVVLASRDRCDASK